MITPEQIKLSDGHAGVTSSGSPVIYVLSKGGLHMFLTKNGGRVEALAAAPHIGIARFFAEKKAGGIDWSPNYIMKSDQLNKAPIIMNQDEEKFPKDVFQETGSIANSYKHKVQKLKSGLYHHIFQDPESVDHPVENDPPQFIHTLSQHADPAKRPLSVIDGLFSHHPEHGSVFRAYKTATAPEHQGKGYGTRLKALATKFHGRMQSDYSLSEPEEQSWQKLARKPNFHFEEAATVFDSEPKGVIREEAENSTHLMTYKPKKLAASEDFLEIRKSFFNKEIMAEEETYAIYNHKEKVIDIMDKEDLISTLKKGDITPYSCFVRRIDVESVPSLIGKK